MATTGAAKWQKYFANKDGVSTVLSGKPGEVIQVFDNKRKPLVKAVDGQPITVLHMSKYEPYYPISLKINNKNMIGLVSEKYVAKPIARKVNITLSRFTALDFASFGTKKTISYMDKDVQVLDFARSDPLERSILAGLKKVEGDKTAAQDAFKAFFASQLKHIPWKAETTPDERGRYGIYIGELLIGLYYLDGKADKVMHPCPIKKKATHFYLPSDPAFSGVDSLTEFADKSLLPVSSKFGVGAKASIFSNIMVKGLGSYKKLKPSVFRDLCEVADDIGVTTTDLESKRRSKDIVYAYGVRKILNIPEGAGAKGVQDSMDIFTSIKKGDINKDVIKVLGKVRTEKNVDPRILADLPNTLTTFFCRMIALRLNKDEKSKEQILSILSGKDYWQANLNINKWQKGEVEFKMTSTKKMKILFIGNKSAMNDLNALQGTVNYEIRPE